MIILICLFYLELPKMFIPYYENIFILTLRKHLHTICVLLDQNNGPESMLTVQRLLDDARNKIFEVIL